MPLPLPTSRKALCLTGLVLAAAVSAGVFLSTRPGILFLGFPSMYRFLLAESSALSGVRYSYWSPEKLDAPQLGRPDFGRYRVVFVSGRRSDPLPRPVREALHAATLGGAKVIVLPAHDTARLGVGNADFEGQDRWMDEYWRFGGPTNMARLLQAAAARYEGRDFQILPPEPTPDDGYYHPGATTLFTSTSDYEAWYRASGRFEPDAPKVLIDFADGWRLGMNRATDALVRAFEDGGFNAAAIFGTAQAAPFALEYEPDILISRKHGRWWLGQQGVDVLERRIDAPVLRGLSLLFTGESFSNYQQTRAGIRDAGLIMGAMVPELDGAIQPTLIEGLDSEWYGRRFEAFQSERISLLVERARRWVRLRTAANSRKKVAVFYVSGIGKGRITAASLNVPRSLIRFLAAMDRSGYKVEGRPSDEAELLAEMLDKGRNVSAGRHRDLHALSEREGVLLLPADGYKRWFAGLPETMRLEVTAAFGPPPGSLMTLDRDGEPVFVVPLLDYGNVIVLPQPVRGAVMDASLQHDDRVPPPHQYLAVYWWLREVWGADAIVNYGTHGTHEFLPGRPLGQLPDDWSDRIIGPLPNLYVYVMDNVGEALIAKRRGSAVTVSHQIPPVKAAEVTREQEEVGQLARRARQFLSAPQGALRESLRAAIRAMGQEQGFDRDLGLDWSARAPADDEIASLEMHIHLVNEDRIPVGLHVHGKPSAPADLAPMLAAMLGERFVTAVGCGDAAPKSACETAARDRAEAAVRRAISGGRLEPPLDAFAQDLDRLRAAFARAPDEITHTLDALAGRYVPPGSGGDPVRNPQALPAGRNLYGVNPAEMPTRAAWEIGVLLAEDQLAAERARLGRWPRRIGFTLWNTELIRQHGTDLAHVLHLLGVRPVWDHREIVEDVELIPSEELQRPRIDVVVQAASLFRDTFPDRMRLLDKAARLAASAADGANYVAEHSAQAETALKQSGMAARDARILAGARVFSNSAGGYGTGLVAAIERSGSYSSSESLTESYLARTGAVYTAGFEWGRPAPAAYRAHLQHTDAVTLSRSTNVVGALTLDHYFEYLGGMTMAVRDTTGSSPETYLADVRDPRKVRMETAREALVRDLRGKFWNPGWIRALQEEGFSGAVEIAQTATNLFGWQVTKPDAVDSATWSRVHRIYMEDSLGLGLPKWLDAANPFAYQEIMAVLLESARKGYWQPGSDALERVALQYAQSLDRHGASGSVRTTENRAFAEFVELRVAASEAPELVTALREELRDGDRPRVEGRMLVDSRIEERRGAPQAGAAAGMAAIGLLAGVFLWGWRRTSRAQRGSAKRRTAE